MSKEALAEQPAQPEQEPVAWQVEVLIQGAWTPMGNPQRDKDRAEKLADNPFIPKECRRIIELYTYPQPAQQCKWPTCQSEEYQQALAEQIKRELVGEQPAQQEPVGWSETYSKVIKALAAIVAVHTPDKMLALDAIPRDPVMGLVHQIRVAIDGYNQPQLKPLTDEEIEDVTRKAADALLDHIYEYGTCAEGTLYRIHAIAKAVEAAHGIKEIK